MHILSGGSKLQIARTQLSDSATYTCVASNVEGKARKNYHLTVQGAALKVQGGQRETLMNSIVFAFSHSRLKAHDKMFIVKSTESGRDFSAKVKYTLSELTVYPLYLV